MERRKPPAAKPSLFAPNEPPSPPPGPITNVAAALVMETAERVNAMCRRRGATQVLNQRLLWMAGECLARQGTVADAVAVAQSELDAVCPEEAPPMEGS